MIGNAEPGARWNCWGFGDQSNGSQVGSDLGYLGPMPQLVTAADMGNRIDKPAIDQTEDAIGKLRVVG